MENIILSQIPLAQLKQEITDSLKAEFQKHFSKPLLEPEVDLITRKEAAAILGVSLPTILDWTKSGKIIGYRISSRIRYKRSEIENSIKKIKTSY